MFLNESVEAFQGRVDEYVTDTTLFGNSKDPLGAYFRK